MFAARLSALLLLWCSYSSTRVVLSYPVLMQVDEATTRCFQFQIPEDDDAHLVAVVLPGEEEMGDDDRVEAWYFDQIYKITQQKNSRQLLAKKFIDDTPDYVASHMSEFYKRQRQGNLSPVRLSLSNSPIDNPHQLQQASKFFTPQVVNYIARATSSRARRHGGNDRSEESLGGYGICLVNGDEENHMQLIMDIVLIGDQMEDDGAEDSDAGGAGFSKDKHLTPLEESLDDSIRAAKGIVKEMTYLEQRERRMRHTSDNINMRVRWFSYLSISILLSVTYIQVTYLKRYFHKKKLM